MRISRNRGDNVSLTTEYANSMLDSLMVERQTWVALHSSDPGESGAGEIEGALYQRQPYPARAAFRAKTVNDDQIEFVSLPPTVISHLAVWSAEDGGDLIWSEEASMAKTVGLGDIYRIDVGQLSIMIRL